VPRIDAGSCEHVDVMLDLSLGGQGRWPSLADACACMGFSLAGPSRAADECRFPLEMQKCERDVIGTAILYFFVLAARRRSNAALKSGLPALGAFLRGPESGRRHLQRFALSALLAEGATAWGA
jgi:hypothetical protein